MVGNQCPRCGSVNVDYEGYCWTCEHQPGPPAGQRVAAPAPGPVARRVPRPGVSGGSEAPERSRAGRLLAITLAPIMTVVVIGACVLGLLAFQKGDALVGAGATPSVVEASRQPGAVESCVIGSWRLTAIEETLTMDDGRTVHGTGAGGTLVLRDDGTGTLDHAGSSMSALLDGLTVTIDQQGVETFGYRLAKGILLIQPKSGSVTMSVLSQGKVIARTNRASDTESTSAEFGCGGNALTLRGKRGTAGKDYYEFNETFVRT